MQDLVELYSQSSGDTETHDAATYRYLADPDRRYFEGDLELPKRGMDYCVNSNRGAFHATTTGRPRNSGWSRCSTDAENASIPALGSPAPLLSDAHSSEHE